MTKSWKSRAVVLCGLAFVVASLLGSANRVEARPQYLKAFAVKYDTVANAAKTKKCAVCHPEKSKKIRNDYGLALSKHVEKNEKDSEALEKALDATAKMKKDENGTFGELIEAGKLPGSDEAAEDAGDE